MQLKPIFLGNTAINNNVFLAPLAGYTNYAFRRLCKGYGAGLCYTEMVSAKGLKYGSENTKELLYTDGEEGLCAAQIFGSEPETMRAACEHDALAPFPIVDINMGCPVPKIYKNGEGSALLEDPFLAEKIVKECVKSGKIITVKFRIGITADKFITTEFAKRMEGAGASLITVHGRTKDKIYAGEVHFAEIAKAKAAVQIPVIANGGVFSNADAETLLNETGADGVMVARAALFHPQIFCELTGMETESKLQMFEKQLKWTQQVCDERFTTVFMRKMAAFYVKGERGAAAYKERLFSTQSPQEILAIAREIWE
ncbi:MAG: tRNA-dihydrouridine synthase [Clostridia bacterium]|nr:tRNA-dihydrouridine synthase [Clostridia bacterium]MBQ9714763.1 tRNA-dihydrouridine synthase [Clostridia bacterium]